LLKDDVPKLSNNATTEPQVNDGVEEEADGSVSPLNLNLGL
jgi:hypothetical protein